MQLGYGLAFVFVVCYAANVVSLLAILRDPAIAIGAGVIGLAMVAYASAPPQVAQHASPRGRRRPRARFGAGT